MSKETIRAEWREKVRNTTPSPSASKTICKNFLSLSHLKSVSQICLFAGRSSEPLLFDVWEHLSGKAFFPKVDVKTSKLQFFRISKLKDLTAGYGGILEPKESCEQVTIGNTGILVGVPGLAFDRQGHRLGSGKGYYDRFLEAHPHAFKLGICFSFQISSTVLSQDKWDIPMDAILTEEEWWTVKK